MKNNFKKNFLNFFKITGSFLKNNHGWSSAFVFLISFLMLGVFYLNNPGVSVIDDHFFLFKDGKNVLEKGIEEAGKNRIFFTEFAHNKDSGRAFYGARYWFIPFVFFDDKLLGLKLGDIALASLALALVFLFFRTNNIKKSSFFILLSLSSSYLIFRLLSGRALVLDGVFLLWEIYFASKKDFKKLIVVSFIHIFWHNSAFYIPLLVIFSVEILRFIFESKVFLKNFFVAAGTFFFFLLIQDSSFWFLPKIWNIVLGVIQESDLSLIQGNEMKKITFSDLFGCSRVIFIFFFFFSISTAFFYYIKIRMNDGEGIEEYENRRDDFLILFSSVLISISLVFGFSAINGRFFDLFPFLSLFTFSFSLKLLFFDELLAIKRPIENFFLWVFLVFLIIFTSNTLVNVSESISNLDPRPFQGAMSWINDRSIGEEMIFLTNWSDFPRAFFYDEKNNYFNVGLEPRDFYDYDPVLFWRWYNIYRYAYYCNYQYDCRDEAEAFFGEERLDLREKLLMENNQKIVNSIKKDFSADFILTTSQQLASVFSSQKDVIQSEANFVSEYSGKKVFVFELKE